MNAEQPTTDRRYGARGSTVIDGGTGRKFCYAYSIEGAQEIADALNAASSSGGASGCGHVPAGYSCVTPGCSNGPAPEPSGRLVTDALRDCIGIASKDLQAEANAELSALLRAVRAAPEPRAESPRRRELVELARKAVRYMENGDPMRDVLDREDIEDIVTLFADSPSTKDEKHG